MGKRAGGEEGMTKGESISERLGPMMKEYYLPATIRNHMKIIGMEPDKIELFVKDVMSSVEKQNDYLKVIEEYNRQTEG